MVNHEIDFDTRGSLINLSNCSEYWFNLCWAILRSSVSILFNCSGFNSGIWILCGRWLQHSNGTCTGWFLYVTFNLVFSVCCFDWILVLPIKALHNDVRWTREEVVIISVFASWFSHFTVIGKASDIEVSHRLVLISCTLYSLATITDIRQVVGRFLCGFKSWASQIALLSIGYASRLEHIKVFAKRVLHLLKSRSGK